MAAAQAEEPILLTLPTGGAIPQLAFGLYKVPSDADGESIITEAIKVREKNDVHMM